jgi:hypothetical protein
MESTKTMTDRVSIIIAIISLVIIWAYGYQLKCLPDAEQVSDVQCWLRSRRKLPRGNRTGLSTLELLGLKDLAELFESKNI